MKLGVGSYTFTWAVGVPGYPVAQPMKAFDLLETARELGAEVVQYCDNLPLTALNASERSELRQKAQNYGIDIEFQQKIYSNTSSWPASLAHRSSESSLTRVPTNPVRRR